MLFRSDSMLRRLDRLCESLSDTLREVVIALFPRMRQTIKNIVKPMRGLRDQMPSMARRQRLVFRMSRKCAEEYDDDYYDAECETARRHVFMRDNPHWRGIMLDTEAEDVSTDSGFGQAPWYVYGFGTSASVVSCKT